MLLKPLPSLLIWGVTDGREGREKKGVGVNLHSMLLLTIHLQRFDPPAPCPRGGGSIPSWLRAALSRPRFAGCPVGSGNGFWIWQPRGTLGPLPLLLLPKASTCH